MAFEEIFSNQVEAFLQNPEVIVLDHRDPQSYANGHISGAQPVTESLLMRLIKGHKTTPILVYCYHGHTSKDIANLLINFGCSKVYNLSGGYSAWSASQEQEPSQV